MSYLKGADFKSDILFGTFWAQIPIFVHFGWKSINSLILTKLLYIYFNLMVEISVITFEKKSANMGIMRRNQSTHLGKILLRCWFQLRHLFVIINSKKLNNRITQFRIFWNRNSLSITWNFITSSININYFGKHLAHCKTFICILFY